MLLEAMALQNHMIAYDLPAYHEFAINGYNAILIEWGNIQKLIDFIRLVSKNEELSSMLIRNSYNTAMDYDLGKYCL
ncbi:MAG: glycosyltransferase [Candidatus Odinarchaeota archaeon]|nr:glycosyltransferase [Candidatus Odinarchaeota archaeon]